MKIKKHVELFEVKISSFIQSPLLRQRRTRRLFGGHQTSGGGLRSRVVRLQDTISPLKWFPLYPSSFIFIVFILLSGCAENIKVFSKGDMEQVVVEGIAPYGSGDMSTAKSKALFDAQKNAVEQFVRLFLSEEVKASKYSMLEERILNTPQVYVKKYRILDESRIGNDYKIRMTAYVMLDKIVSALRDMGMTGQGAKFMKAALVLKESGNNSAVSFNDTYSGIKSTFEKGSSMELVNYLPGDFKDTDLNEEVSVLASAKKLGAQFLFLAESSAFKFHEMSQIQTGFVPYRSTVRLKVFDLDSDKSVMELSTQSNAIDSSEELARRKAQYLAGELMGQELARKIDKIAKAVSPIRIRMVSLHGIEKIKNIRDMLSSMGGVSQLHLEDYSQGQALFLVWTNINTLEEFASRIIRTSTVQLELESIHHSEIVFEVLQ